MPRIAHSEKVLNGKGRVILYENGDSAGKWFYKEKIEGSKDSYRSTFIENHILRGTDAYLLARICGNSVATIMQTYERIDIRKRTKELTDIEFGKKREKPETIQLFDD